MATVIETVVRDGKTIAVYDNGMERDVERNRIIKPPPAALITKENANEYKRKRQEKAAAALRMRITEATNAVSEIKHNTSAAAIADVGGMLFSEIVLNPEAYPRDRMEAFEKLGKMAELIPDGKDKSDEPVRNVNIVVDATALLSKLQEFLTPGNVVEGRLVPESGISGSDNLRIGEGDDSSPTGEEDEET